MDTPSPKAVVVGVAGVALRPEETDLLRRYAPVGVILFGRNVADPMQLVALTAALREMLPAGAMIMVDQEGGRVARLRPPHWRGHPAAGVIGALHRRSPPAARRAAWLQGALIGAECASMGFDMVCAPVLDLVLPGMNAVVGDRGFSEDPSVVAELGREMAEGLLAAGVMPVVKHAPGHGRALVDSHAAMPVAEGDLDADLLPFGANADLPVMMTAHLLYPAYDKVYPGTFSAAVIGGVIRERIGFGGLLLSDDLAMGALSGSPDARCLAALAAGCDVALYCPGRAVENAAVLAAVPALSAASIRRLAAARATAAARRVALDPAALAAERECLV